MRTPRFFVQVVLVAALLAGCVDDSPPAESTEAEPLSGVPAPPSTPAPDSEEPRPTPAPLEPMQTWAVNEDGFLPAGMGGAGIVGFFRPGFDRWFPQDFNGTVVNATLTMTWDAQSPATEHLLLAFGIMKDDDGRQYSETYEYVSGPSPLSLELRNLDWAAKDFVVWGWFEPFIVQGGTGQSFAIKGQVSGLAG